MRYCVFYILFLFAVTLSFQGTAQPGKTLRVREQLQHKLDSFQKANQFPGATFSAVLSNGETISIATGLADSATNQPMQPNHRLLAGSIGKTFFVAAVVNLVHLGKIKLDDPISKYLSSETWFNRIPNAQDISIRMLLNHTSGIEEYYEIGDFMQQLKLNPDKSWKPEETFAYIFDRKPLFAAGTGWGYADTNYLILGYLIEKVMGKKMYQLAYQYALKPNALTYTEPSDKRKLKNLATGYSRENSPFPYAGAMVKNGQLVFNPQFEWTGGGFVSNSLDLAKWAKAFYNLNSVSSEIRKEMQTGVKANTGKDHQYGLGMQIKPAGNGFGFGHSGWFPGYISECEYFPEIDLSVAIQFNTDNFRLVKRSTHTYLLELKDIIEKMMN